MLKYTFYRLLAACLAIFAAIIITFFAMHLVPGHPTPPISDRTLQDKQEYWAHYGIYDMSTHTFTTAGQQFIWFMHHLNPFGVYFSGSNNSTISVSVLFDNSMLVTCAYALPAFAISTLIGVWMGYYAAKFRGKIVDSIINMLAVLMSALPVFILGILLFQLAGIVGLPAQFVHFDSHDPLKVYESLILPTTVVTLMGLPSVVFMSRNEFAEIFKSEFIKTAKGKGLSNIRIFWKHVLRNALMPILYASSGNLLLIFGGSIIIQMIFDITGTNGFGLGELLADGVTQHQYYLECFSILFFGSIYFLYALLLDWAYVLVDPRVTLRTNSELLSFKSLINRIRYRNQKYLAKKVQKVLVPDVTEKKLTRNDKTFNRVMQNEKIQWHALNYFKNEDYLNETTIKNERFEIKNLQTMVVDADTGVKTDAVYHFNQVKLFKPVDSLKMNSDRIGDSNVPTWIVSIRIFAKNKLALLLAGIMIFLVLFFAIWSFASPYSASQAVASNVALVHLQYLPPRALWMGPHAIAIKHIFTSVAVYDTAVKQGWADPNVIASYSNNHPFIVAYIYPYAINGLQHIYPLLGTNKYGVDFLTELSYAFSRVVLFTIVVILGSTLIGLIYGGIQGSFAGSNADIIMQWITQVIGSVPMLLWVIIFGVSFTHGTLTLWNLAWILILLMWPGIATITRLYVIKYKDYEFVQAARIIGTPRFKIVMKHLLPNTFGKVTVFALNSFGGIMQWPSFLLFIGLSSSFGISLSNIIFDQYQATSVHWNLMLSVMSLYVFPYLAFQVVANAINDSLDSRN